MQLLEQVRDARSIIMSPIQGWIFNLLLPLYRVLMLLSEDDDYLCGLCLVRGVVVAESAPNLLLCVLDLGAECNARAPVFV